MSNLLGQVLRIDTTEDGRAGAVDAERIVNHPRLMPLHGHAEDPHRSAAGPEDDLVSAVGDVEPVESAVREIAESADGEHVITVDDHIDVATAGLVQIEDVDR